MLFLTVIVQFMGLQKYDLCITTLLTRTTLKHGRSHCLVRANNSLPLQKVSQEGNRSVVVENKLDSTNNHHCSSIPDCSSVPTILH